MKKKMYPQPEMKVVKLEQTDIICTSGDYSSPQNERYGLTGINLCLAKNVSESKEEERDIHDTPQLSSKRFDL